MDPGIIVAICAGCILYTVIFTMVELSCINEHFSENMVCGVDYFCVSPYYFIQEGSECNLFGRWFISIIMGLLNPIWTLICIVRFLCTVHKER